MTTIAANLSVALDGYFAGPHPPDRPVQAGAGQGTAEDLDVGQLGHAASSPGQPGEVTPRRG